MTKDSLIHSDPDSSHLHMSFWFGEGVSLFLSSSGLFLSSFFPFYLLLAFQLSLYTLERKNRTQIPGFATWSLRNLGQAKPLP